MSSISRSFGRYVKDIDTTSYSDLFSPDSDNVDFESDDTKQFLDPLDMQGHQGVRILNIKDTLKELDLLHDMKGDTIYNKDENSDMSISSGGSMMFMESESENFEVQAGNNLKEILGKVDTKQESRGDKVYFEDGGSDMSISSGGSMLFCTVEDTIEDDLDVSVSSVESIQSLTQEQCEGILFDDSKEKVDIQNRRLGALSTDIESGHTSEETQEDIIGSFNIQNKYDHNIASQLFLEGNFTFLSLQEPLASHTKVNEAWKSCRRLELDSARITCHETHHQIIMYDAWKWGGKVLSNFGAKMNGRIAHIAFQFENQQKLGIISVYAVARGGASPENLRDREKLRRETVTLIKKQYKAWMNAFPGIQIMIMGDLQETISKTDQDNLGQSRFVNNKDNGIFQAFKGTHVSLARDRNSDKPYLTRFGREGARGIDHILFPEDGANSFIKDALVHDFLGMSSFPSDHRLISCTYLRNGTNNAENASLREKYEFNKISNIKLKTIISENRVPELVFDDSQFQGSAKMKEQRKLYNRVQELTGQDGSSTLYHLPHIEGRIKKLFNSLWQDGIDQNACGKDNVLVKICEKQAAELSHIVNLYDYAIKDSMTFLHLVKLNDCLGQKALTRNNIRLKQEFKLFGNLPISTKLRYIRCSIQRKIRSLQSYINFLDENATRESNDCIERVNFAKAFSKWKITCNSKKLQTRTSDVYTKYMLEWEERKNHMNAVSYGRNTSVSNTPTSQTQKDVNFLYHLPDKTIRLINLWLHESKCGQGFNLNSTNNDRFSFLSKDSWEWNTFLGKADATIHKGYVDEKSSISLRENLNLAREDLKKFEGKISNAQRQYKADTIHFLLQINKIEDFTRKINPKKRDAPATHTEIWDENLQKFRLCRNESEELIATGAFHGHWMSNSAALETCAFAKIKREGLLGARGVELSPDRVVGLADVKKLVKNGEKLPGYLKQAFVKAHGKHTSDLFRAPEKAHPELHYPFFMTTNDGDIKNEETMKSNFCNAISKIPGKARYEGFHMAVVGRFGRRWQQCLYQISKLILVMRFVPKKLKSIARFPIPKPGRVNEYRPISLCHDLYCYINAISTLHSSSGIAKANILHEGITAYVKGKGCTTLVGVEQAVREDCVESGVPTSQTDEDEEKYFDRIPVEILLAAMKVNGFPDQGYLELKASGMEAKSVEIITAKGVAHARFVCGLEQGNPDSPTVSNLVIKFKHDIWLNVLDEIKNKAKSDDANSSTNKVKTNADAYTFRVVDPLDGVITVDRIGYCDDNTRYTSSYNEQEVITATEKYIQRAGDLSMVTKIGRKGSKSEVHYFNLSAETALKVKKIKSIAWSFTTDGPQEEYVPFKIALHQNELEKVFKLSNFQNLDTEQQQNLLDVFQSKPHKHLGLKSTLKGETSAASLEVVQKIKARLNQLNIYSFEREAQRICSNMLCTTMHSYAPLQMAHAAADLEDCDKCLVNLIRKRHGLSTSDAKHALFIDTDKGGFGFKSFLDVDLISTIRELEIVLNGMMLDSKTSRSRLQAYTIRQDREMDGLCLNFIGSAIEKIAKYGFHIRDKYDGIINYILANLNKQKRYVAVGHDNYRHADGYSIGSGKVRSLDIAYGSQLHIYLQNAIDSTTGTWKPNVPDLAQLEIPISRLRINKLLKSERTRQFEDRSICYNYWEWTCDGKDSKDTLDKVDCWKYVNIMEILKGKYPNSFWQLSGERIHMEALAISNRSMEQRFFKDRLLINKYPAFLATDGSHSEQQRNDEDREKNNHVTTSAVVICMPNLMDGEKWEDGKWQQRPAIPVLARAQALPKSFGVHASDIGHGEGIACCMAIEMITTLHRGVILTDSQAIRDVAMQIRDRDDKVELDRRYIRKVIAGIGKSVGNRLNRSFQQLDKLQEHEDCTPLSKMEAFLELSEQWIQPAESPIEAKKSSKWTRECWDDHERSPILKIASHQLNEDGTAIKKKPRYPNLTPNLFVLSCNHFADRCAGIVASKAFAINNLPDSIQIPEAELRFTVIWSGAGIDKHVSEFTHSMIQKERLRRLRAKPTQGLPWRIVRDSKTWKELGGFGRLLQSLKGFTRTHTRSLYKSSIYRNGCMEVYKESRLSQNPSYMDTNKTSSLSQWNQKLSPCNWCHNTHDCKGNRYHAILFCEHPDLAKFRANISQLLEAQLFDLLKNIRETQSFSDGEAFIQQIEVMMIKLHDRHNMEESIQHTVYRTRKEWMQEENMEDWSDMLASEIPILCHIFGFNPVLELQLETDLEMNHARCIPFGYIPAQMEASIKMLGKTLRNHYADIEVHRCIQQGYEKRWNVIKDILRARVMGLHSIIGTISSTMETEFEKRARMVNAASGDVVKDEQPRHLRQPSILKKFNENKDSGRVIDRKRKRVRFLNDNSNPVRKKSCTGITCNKDFDKLHFVSKIKNSIEFNKKHCQRCSRKHTAIRKCIHILQNDKSTIDTSTATKITLIADKTSNEPQHKSILQALRPLDKSCSIIPEQKRLTDTTKNILQTMTSCIARSTDRDHSPTLRLDAALTHFKAVNENTNKFLKADLKRNIDLDRNMLSIASNIQKKIKVANVNGKKEKITERVWISSQESRDLKEDKIQTLERHKYMSNRTMNRAVTNLRNEAYANIYIGVTSSAQLIDNLPLEAPWEDFAIIFRSVKVIQEKPCGTYLIPLFTGADLSGHWSFIIVSKQYKLRRMWVIDSLGRGNSMNRVVKRVRKAFSSCKCRCRWEEVGTMKQSEAECGPRTIMGMVSMCQALSQGKSIEEAIATSSGNAGNRLRLESEEVRRRAVEWIDESEDTRATYERGEAAIRKFLRRRRVTQRHRSTAARKHMDEEKKACIEID